MPSTVKSGQKSRRNGSSATSHPGSPSPSKASSSGDRANQSVAAHNDVAVQHQPSDEQTIPGSGQDRGDFDQGIIFRPDSPTWQLYELRLRRSVPVTTHSTPQAVAPIASSERPSGISSAHVAVPMNPSLTSPNGTSPQANLYQAPIRTTANRNNETKAGPSEPSTTAPATSALAAPTGELRRCSKACSGGARPLSAFERSAEPYGPTRIYKHCNNCTAKYQMKISPVEFRNLYLSPDPERHRQWKAAGTNRRHGH